jgi:hypothetical protein
MKKTLIKLVSSLIAGILIVVVGCQQDPLPNSDDVLLKKLTKEEYLDSLFSNNIGLATLWMIDTTVVKGSMGWGVRDTVMFDANDPNLVWNKYHWYPIRNFEPLSPDKDKFAIYSRIVRYISFKAADSASQFGSSTGDTTLVIGMREFQRISQAYTAKSEMEISDFLFDFPHKKSNEKEVCDSFISHYRPLAGLWDGDHLNFPIWHGGDFEEFYNRPTDKRIFDNDIHVFNGVDQNVYCYMFKSGKVTFDEPFDKDIFENELERDDFNTMEILNQTLSDGRVHRVMFVKIPYTYWKDHPYVSGFVRLRYVLD